MKNYFKILIFLSLLAIPSLTSGQHDKLFVYCDTTRDINSRQILLVSSTGSLNHGIVIKNDISDFTFNGRIFDNARNEYILFSSFSESVGCNFYYLFDIERKKIYSSNAILELEVPFIFSFNRDALSMNLASIDPLSCGKISILRFKIEPMQNYVKDYLNRLKVYITIDL